MCIFNQSHVIPSTTHQQKQVLALPLLTASVKAAAAGTAQHFGYFPGPLFMPPDAVATAAGGEEKDADPDAAIKGSVASLLSLPAVQALVGDEGGKRRALIEKGALSFVGLAEKMRTHK